MKNYIEATPCFRNGRSYGDPDGIAGSNLSVCHKELANLLKEIHSKEEKIKELLR
jgi:hypothetical protein